MAESNGRANVRAFTGDHAGLCGCAGVRRLAPCTAAPTSVPLAILKLLLTALLGAATLLSLPGCATGSAGTQSAERIEIAPAFGERYEACRALAEKVSDDSVLLVVSQVRDATEGVVPAWQYDFASWEYAQIFQVLYKDGEPALGDTHGSDLTRSEMEAIPPASEIAIDADEAYRLVAEQLSDEEIVESCFVYLMTYVKEDDDPTENAMAWFFVFNRPDETPVDDTVIVEDSENASASSFAYRVDVRTGEVSPCAP